MVHRRAAIVALVLGAALVASIFVVVPALTLVATDEGPKRILALDPNRYYRSQDEPITMNAVRITDLEPNSFVGFLDPYGKTMQELGSENRTSITLDSKQAALFQNRDPYENYMLIRLPEWLGGGKDDSSAVRAYHAISLTDKCIHRYWSTEGRWRMENPCAGDMYRPWDGYAFGGPAAQGFVGFVPSKGFYPALQMPRLSVDGEGYVIAFKPDNNPNGDGSQGEGRQMSPSDLGRSNAAMISVASEYSGYSLPFPASIAPDYRLSQLTPAGVPWWVKQVGPVRALQASYSTGTEYAPITIDVFATDQFPDMALGGPLVSRSNDSGYLVNGTLVNALIHLDYYHEISDARLQVRSGADIAGDYAILAAPSQVSEGSDIGSGALVWAKSADGKKDIVVVVNSRSMTIEELTRLVQSIGIMENQVE